MNYRSHTILQTGADPKPQLLPWILGGLREPGSSIVTTLETFNGIVIYEYRDQTQLMQLKCWAEFYGLRVAYDVETDRIRFFNPPQTEASVPGKTLTNALCGVFLVALLCVPDSSNQARAQHAAAPPMPPRDPKPSQYYPVHSENAVFWLRAGPVNPVPLGTNAVLPKLPGIPPSRKAALLVLDNPTNSPYCQIEVSTNGSAWSRVTNAPFVSGAAFTVIVDQRDAPPNMELYRIAAISNLPPRDVGVMWDPPLPGDSSDGIRLYTALDSPINWKPFVTLIGKSNTQFVFTGMPSTNTIYVYATRYYWDLESEPSNIVKIKKPIIQPQR
jgi:hypothetical protein